MKKIINKIAIALGIVLISVAAVACQKSYEQMTPAEQQKEYEQFQADSLKNCTQNERLAKAFVEGAFDRIPENNGYYKKDKVTVVYDAEQQCWLGTVQYHVDRNNTYYQNEQKFRVYIWETFNGLAKDSEVFYKVVPE